MAGCLHVAALSGHFFVSAMVNGHVSVEARTGERVVAGWYWYGVVV